MNLLLKFLLVFCLGTLAMACGSDTEVSSDDGSEAQEQAVEDALAARRDREILANRVADARMQKIAELGYDPALQLREQAIMRENTPAPPQPYAPEATPIQPIALADEEDAVIEDLLRRRQQERLQRALPQSMIDAIIAAQQRGRICLLYTSPSPRD